MQRQVDIKPAEWVKLSIVSFFFLRSPCTFINVGCCSVRKLRWSFDPESISQNWLVAHLLSIPNLEKELVIIVYSSMLPLHALSGQNCYQLHLMDKKVEIKRLDKSPHTT